EALRQGQIDAGVVQEPALTLLRRAGARVLMNAMDLEDATRHLGGAFEFMGLAVRTKEIERRRPEMVALAGALGEALEARRARRVLAASSVGLGPRARASRAWCVP